MDASELLLAKKHLRGLRIRLTFLLALLQIAVIAASAATLIFLASRQSWFEGLRDQLTSAYSSLMFPILGIGGGVVIVSTILSYFIAGMVLRPLSRSNTLLQKAPAEPDATPKKPVASVPIENVTPHSHLSHKGKLGEMLTDLLKISEFNEIEDLEKTIEAVDLRTLMTKMIREFEPYAKEHKITMTASIAAGETPLVITGNIAYISRAIGNLIKNSIDYNYPEGKVVITVSTDIDNVVVKIKDTGTGIPGEQLSALFDRFYKVGKDEAPDKKDVSGLGVVQSIIHAYGGEVKIQSTKDKGATTTLTFPLQL